MTIISEKTTTTVEVIELELTPTQYVTEAIKLWSNEPDLSVDDLVEAIVAGVQDAQWTDDDGFVFPSDVLLEIHLGLKRHAREIEKALNEVFS